MVELKDANMKQASRWNCEETEIDLYQCIKVLIKRKITFVVVFLLFFAAGLGWSLSFPKIYRISAVIQSSVSRGASLAIADDLESAKSLKNLIINNAFNETLSKRLKLYPDDNCLRFDVVIPDKTNKLQISIDLEKSKKEFGVVILRNLADLISERYDRQTETKLVDISSQIKSKEHFIESVKKEANNLQKQVKEIKDEDSGMRKKIKALNAKMAQILANLKVALKEKAAEDNADITLSLNNLIQNDLNYSNHLNDQLSELSIRKDKLNFEVGNIDYQISDARMKIEKLNSNRNFIPSIRILSQPKISSLPIKVIRGKVLVLMINMGVLFGVLAVFLQEYWSTRHRKS